MCANLQQIRSERVIVCPVKCREVTVKKKRVETFRNIRYGDGRTIPLHGQRSSCESPGGARSGSPQLCVVQRCVGNGKLPEWISDSTYYNSRCVEENCFSTPHLTFQPGQSGFSSGVWNWKWKVCFPFRPSSVEFQGNVAFLFNLYHIYIYIYIYVCVCVCVCV